MDDAVGKRAVSVGDKIAEKRGGNMNVEMKAEYRGYVIKWDDYMRKFKIEMDGVVVKDKLQTVDDCKKWIETKTKQKFKRIPVFIYKGWGGERNIVSGEATSVIDTDYVWVVTSGGRSKENVSGVMVDSPENRILIEQIKSKGADIRRIDGELRALAETLQKITTSMLEI